MPNRLLLVDDEPAILIGLRNYFTARGWVVDCALEVEEARALLGHNSYDALIADLRLTPAHGAEGLDIISFARRCSPATRLVLLTAHSSPIVAAEAQRRGAHRVLDKPLSLPDLERAVCALLEAHG